MILATSELSRVTAEAREASTRARRLARPSVQLRKVRHFIDLLRKSASMTTSDPSLSSLSNGIARRESAGKMGKTELKYAALERVRLQQEMQLSVMFCMGR